MKKIKRIAVILVVFIGLQTYAQQSPHYTQYMYNMNVINPAYAGARADLSIGLLARKQWVGVEGAPETQTFSANARTLNGIGLGLSVVHDKLGLAEATNFNADISYTLVTSTYSRLALGFKGGLSSYSNNLSQGVTPDNDVNPDLSGTYPNLGLGAFYYDKQFYVGLSIPQLFKTPVYRLDNNEYSSGISKKLNYFATFGYVFDVNEKLKFKPSTLIKVATGLPLSVDINANILYDRRLEFGVSYRYNDSVHGMVALLFNESIRIGYAYDHTLTNLGGFNSGTHEIMLLFDIGFQKRGRWLNDSSCYF